MPGGDAQVEAFAVCCDCGTDIPAWRDRLLPIETATFGVSQAGTLALHVERSGACTACGGARVEIRVEARHDAR